MKQPTTSAQPRLMPSKEVHEQYFPWSQMTTWRKLRDGSIPRPIILGRKRYWRIDELEDWLSARSAERLGSGSSKS